jgi:adenosylmethionine-8-amino-7-oxononanoate aminotransferase
MAGFDLLKDPDNDTPFDGSMGMGAKLLGAAKERGLITRVRGDSYLLAPPLITTASQVDDILSILEDSVNAVTAGV